MRKTRKELRKISKQQSRNKLAKRAVTTSAVAFGMGLGLTSINSSKAEAATSSNWSIRPVANIKSDLASEGYTPYKIKWGDTLSTIVEAAKENGLNTSVDELAKINHIQDKDLIYTNGDLWLKATPSNGMATVTTPSGSNNSMNLNPDGTLSNVNDGGTTGSQNGSGNNSSNSNSNNNNGSNSNSGSGSNSGNNNNNSGNNSGNDNGSNNGGNGNNENPTNPTTEKVKYEIVLKNKETGKEIQSSTGEDEIGSTVKFTAKNEITVDGKKYKLADASKTEYSIKLDKDATKNVITVEYNEDTTAPTEKASVTVNAVDENGKTIKTDKVDDLNVGDSYTAQAPAIDGYKLNDESSKTITLSKDNNTITFKYVKDSTPVEKTSVTINAVDENGKNIKTDTVNDLNVGDEYTANAPKVDGYKLNDDSTKKITLAQSGNTITFKYVKEDTPVEKTSYTVSYQDEAGNKIKDDKTVSDQVVGSTVKENAPKIDGYTVKGDASQSLTLKATGNKIVFTYIKNTTHPTPPVPGNGAVGLLDNNGTYNGMTGWDILETYNNGVSDWKDNYGNSWHKGFLLFDTAQHANEFGDKYLDDNILNQNSYNGYGYTGVYGKDKTTIIGYALEWKNFGPNNE